MARHHQLSIINHQPSAISPSRYNSNLLADRLMAGQRFLVPSVKVRVLVRQPMRALGRL